MLYKYLVKNKNFCQTKYVLSNLLQIILTFDSLKSKKFEKIMQPFAILDKRKNRFDELYKCQMFVQSARYVVKFDEMFVQQIFLILD